MFLSWHFSHLKVIKDDLIFGIGDGNKSLNIHLDALILYISSSSALTMNKLKKIELILS